MARFSVRHSRSLPRSFPLSTPVIPAKAGIQTASAKPAARNHVQIASDKSLPPLWGKARMGVSPRARAATGGGSNPPAQGHGVAARTRGDLKPLQQRLRVFGVAARTRGDRGRSARSNGNRGVGARLPRRHPPISPRHSRFPPVIPAKAGIQSASAKPATRNHVQIASDKSLPPYELTGVGLRPGTRASARRRVCGMCNSSRG